MFQKAFVYVRGRREIERERENMLIDWFAPLLPATAGGAGPG